MHCLVGLNINNYVISKSFRIHVLVFTKMLEKNPINFQVGENVWLFFFFSNNFLIIFPNNFILGRALKYRFKVRIFPQTGYIQTQYSTYFYQKSTYSVISGIIAEILTYPLDLMRTDMHKSPRATFFRRKAISDIPYQSTHLCLHYDKLSTSKRVISRTGCIQQVT